MESHTQISTGFEKMFLVKNIALVHLFDQNLFKKLINLFCFKYEIKTLYFKTGYRFVNVLDKLNINSNLIKVDNKNIEDMDLYCEKIVYKTTLTKLNKILNVVLSYKRPHHYERQLLHCSSDESSSCH